MFPIINNPYRIFGVYANASAKELMANKGKLEAYVRIGKPCTFSASLNGFLPEIQCSPEKLTKAFAQFTFPKDKIGHALFWFICGDKMDEVALNYLQVGNAEKALEIFGRRDTYSSLLNRAVIYAAQNKFAYFIAYMDLLIHDEVFRQQFIADVTDATFTISEEELMQLCLDELFNAAFTDQRKTFLLFLKNNAYTCDYKQYKKHTEEKLKNKITGELSRSKLISKKDSHKCLDSANRIKDVVVPVLKKL